MEANIPRNGKQPAAGEGVIIADMDFRVIAMNEAAQATLRNFNNSPHDNPEATPGLPDEIVKVLSTRSKDSLQPIVFSINGRNGEYSCRAFLLKGGGMSTTAPMLTLHIKRELSVTDAVHQVGLQYNLTQREQEALIGISMGLTSKQLAKRMKISPNTVKAFLRLIMIKMGAATRAGVVGKLLEQNVPAKQFHLDREV